MKNSKNLKKELKEIVFTRASWTGTSEEQLESARTITAFLEALPKSSNAWGYNGKRIVVAVRDFADQIHVGWVVNNDFLNFKNCFKYLYILSYELKIKENLEGKKARTLIYQEESDDGRHQHLFQRRICFLNRDFKNDPDMFDENAIGYKTWPDCSKDMIEKFINQSEVNDYIAKEVFQRLLSGDIKKLEDISNFPSKEEGERIIAETERKKAEEARKKDLQELQMELKGIPKYIKDLTTEEFKKALNVIAYRYHAYNFEDAVVETLDNQRIKMNLTKKMWFIWEPGVIKLYFKNYELEIGISCNSSLKDLEQAKTTDLKNLFNEIHSIFEDKFPNILDRDIFFSKVLRDFHKYFHGASAW